MSYSPLIELNPDIRVDTRATAAMFKPAPFTLANSHSTGAKRLPYILSRQTS